MSEPNNERRHDHELYLSPGYAPVPLKIRDHIAAREEQLIEALKVAEGMEHDQNCPAGWVNVPLPKHCSPACARGRLIAILKGETK